MRRQYAKLSIHILRRERREIHTNKTVRFKKRHLIKIPNPIKNNLRVLHVQEFFINLILNCMYVYVSQIFKLTKTIYDSKVVS